MDCTIEAYVTEFFDDHDAIDCKFAYRFTGQDDVFGADRVRACILDALGNRRAFVGGYILAGIDSSSTYAYLGTADGEIELVLQHWFNTRSLSRTRCSMIVENSETTQGIGLGCAGMNFEPVCAEQE